jgi:hypothetical protein
MGSSQPVNLCSPTQRQNEDACLERSEMRTALIMQDVYGPLGSIESIPASAPAPAAAAAAKF